MEMYYLMHVSANLTDGFFTICWTDRADKSLIMGSGMVTCTITCEDKVTQESFLDCPSWLIPQNMHILNWRNMRFTAGRGNTSFYNNNHPCARESNRKMIVFAMEKTLPGRVIVRVIVASKKKKLFFFFRSNNYPNNNPSWASNLVL